MDIWDGVKKGLSVFAPIIANALEPGSGGMVGGLLSEVLGCDNNPDTIAAALQNVTPEQKSQIIKIQQDHKAKLIELATENDKAYLADRQSARARQVAHEQATGKTDVNLYALAWMTVLCFFGLVGTLMFVDLPSSNVGPINQLFGTMGTGFAMVLGYFFGTSKSSSDKTKLLAK